MLRGKRSRRMRHLKNKAAIAACFAILSCQLTACGFGANNTANEDEAAASAEETLVGTEEGETSVSDLSDNAEQGENTGAEEGTYVNESTYAGMDNYEESMAAKKEELAEDESPYFGIMHVSITDINGNVGESNTVYSFRDKTDPENIWSVTGLEIGDIEAEMAVGNDVAVLFNGDIVKDAENLQFMVLLPDGSYELKEAEGVTTGNTMSVFTVRTADGNTIDFMKDNCRIDEAALRADMGDKVKVYYADGGELGKFPFRVLAAG